MKHSWTHIEYNYRYYNDIAVEVYNMPAECVRYLNDSITVLASADVINDSMRLLGDD